MGFLKGGDAGGAAGASAGAEAHPSLGHSIESAFSQHFPIASVLGGKIFGGQSPSVQPQAPVVNTNAATELPAFNMPTAMPDLGGDLISMNAKPKSSGIGAAILKALI
jgi:hypothetical protein